MKAPTYDSQQRADIVSLTLLRAATGIILAIHGAMKLMDVPGTIEGFTQWGIPYPRVLLYLAVAGELFGGLGLAIGFLTRVAALGTLATMLVAIVYVHVGHGLLMANGGWEYPLVLVMVSLLFVTHGAGPASLDAVLAKNLGRGSGNRPARATG